MKLQHYAGVDPAKLTFMIAVWPDGDHTQEEVREFSNTTSGYTQLGYWLKDLGVAPEALLCCVEHTGQYSLGLSFWLHEQGVLVWKEMPLVIKRSLGLVRGKSDRFDAQQIARYCFTHQHEAQAWEPPSKSIQKLAAMIAQRSRLIDTRTRLTVPIGELEQTQAKQQAQLLSTLCASTLKGIDKDLERIEAAIDELLAKDQQLGDQYQLLCSVPGIGRVTACLLIVHTRAFTRFEHPRQLACYCGVAPFEHSSGTSIRGKTRVSHMANKTLKKAMHMAAVSVTRSKNDIAEYYHRKLAEGKNKMLVINAVRNKLLHVAMAVVQRGTPYQKVHPELA